MKPTPPRTRGYVLGEIILALLVSAIIAGALLGGLVALVRGLQPPRVVIDGETLPVAPTFGSFPSAVRLHQSLTLHLSSGRAVYIFGGRHLSIPAGSPPTTVQPLRLQSLPVINDFVPGLPMDAKSFYDRYSSNLGEFEPGTSADDFTLLVIGVANGALAPTCFVQVRRHDADLPDGGSVSHYIVREVRLWDGDGLQRYAFAERPLQSAGVFTGVVHTWFRYNGEVAEEGPACAVFPDPWLYAGRRDQSDVLPPFSRFGYLIPVSR